MSGILFRTSYSYNRIGRTSFTFSITFQTFCAQTILPFADIFIVLHVHGNLITHELIGLSFVFIVFAFSDFSCFQMAPFIFVSSVKIGARLLSASWPTVCDKNRIFSDIKMTLKNQMAITEGDQF